MAVKTFPDNLAQERYVYEKARRRLEETLEGIHATNANWLKEEGYCLSSSGFDEKIKNKLEERGYKLVLYGYACTGGNWLRDETDQYIEFLGKGVVRYRSLPRQKFEVSNHVFLYANGSISAIMARVDMDVRKFYNWQDLSKTCVKCSAAMKTALAKPLGEAEQAARKNAGARVVYGLSAAVNHEKMTFDIVLQRTNIPASEAVSRLWNVHGQLAAGHLLLSGKGGNVSKINFGGTFGRGRWSPPTDE